MNIEVLFFGQLRELTGEREINATLKSGAVISDLMEYLGQEYGDSFRTELDSIQGLRILINGRESFLLGGMVAPLADGDTVVLLPAIFGG